MQINSDKHVESKLTHEFHFLKCFKYNPQVLQQSLLV